MQSKYVWMFFIVGLASGVFAQTNPIIQSFSGHGDLSWSNYPDALEYKVEWTSDPSENWSSSWESLTGIAATGTYYTVEVPMFYRLVAIMPDYARLLLHCDGTDGATNFPDATGNHNIQVTGNIDVSTSTVKFGTGSASFDGTPNHWLAIDDSPDFTPGTNPFTIDFWMYPTNEAASGQYLMGKSYPDSGRGYDVRFHENAINVVGINGWAINITSPATITNGAWYHVAIVCQTNQTDLYIDGTHQGTSARGNISDTSDAFHIGDSPGFGDNAYHGYLDEIRFSLGIARWTNDFTVPSAPWPDD